MMIRDSKIKKKITSDSPKNPSPPRPPRPSCPAAGACGWRRSWGELRHRAASCWRPRAPSPANFTNGPMVFQFFTQNENIWKPRVSSWFGGAELRGAWFSWSVDSWNINKNWSLSNKNMGAAHVFSPRKMWNHEKMQIRPNQQKCNLNNNYGDLATKIWTS